MKSSYGGGVIRLLHNDKKSDVQYMRNTGLKEATGKVIIFFDADTAISENFIENMVKPIINNKADTTLSKLTPFLKLFTIFFPKNILKAMFIL